MRNTGDKVVVEPLRQQIPFARRHEPATAVTDTGRLRRIAHDHLPRVYRLLRQLGVPPGDVDDACQQVFLILAGRLTDVEVQKEQAFLSSTAVRIAWRWRRTHRRRREVCDDEQLQRCPAQGPSPEQRFAAAEAEEALLNVLERLPEPLREVFVLFETEEMTLRDIAETLELPQGTVASRLRSARRLFQQAVSELNLLEQSRRSP